MSAGRTGRTSAPMVWSRRPLPEVARRLRSAFPELWTRYRVLESSCDLDELRPPTATARHRPARSS